MASRRSVRHPIVVGLALATALAGCAQGPTTTPQITPGTPARPRDVNLIARDDVFSPPHLDVVPGETIVLHVLNGGLENHEAIIGDQEVQDAWEAAEANAPAVRPGMSPEISVPPGLNGLRVVVGSGVRVDLAWTVPSDPAVVASLIVGCHVPGHYAKGMHVPVTVARTVGGGG